MIDRLTCPYCNTTFRPVATADLICPRCGEAIPESASNVTPPSHLGNIPTDSVNGSVSYPDPVTAPAVTRQLWPLAAIGVVLLLLTITAGGIELFRSPPTPSPSQPKPPSTWPPTAIPGLAYLPARSNVVFAIQPRALTHYSSRKGIDPSAILPEQFRAFLTASKIDADRVEAIVGGAVIQDNNPLPPLVVALTGSDLLDESLLWNSLKAERDPDHPGRFKADLGGLPVFATKVSNRTVVLATRQTDLDELAVRASPQLSSDIQESLGKLSPASVLWAVTGKATWEEKPELKLWASLLKKPEWIKQLSGVSAAAVGISLEPDPTLRVSVCGNENAKQGLATTVGEPTSDGAWFTAERAVNLIPKK